VVVPVTLVASAPEHSLSLILTATTKNNPADTIFPHSEVNFSVHNTKQKQKYLKIFFRISATRF
jgi:hypothetical protein